jgi:pyruvate formate-lyase/glycerol dehydratase family glycyl radical enzyme
MTNISGKAYPSERILSLRRKTVSAERYLSLEQAGIITRVYRQKSDLPVILKRAYSLSASLDEISITIDPQELIAGNRTVGIRAGVVFPEAGISWLEREIETLPSRPQDPFHVRPEDISFFRDHIAPFWRGKTLEDDIYGAAGEEISAIETVVKINQKDHAQGHICPDVKSWLIHGPSALAANALSLSGSSSGEKKLFFEAAGMVLAAACRFMERYSGLAARLAGDEPDEKLRGNLMQVSANCHNLSTGPPSTFREAVQSVWFLFVILQMESNASSFSPGRMDQYLIDFYRKDVAAGILDNEIALELMDALFIKFNQIVYMRNGKSARYFAGFPTGFNITVGGTGKNGEDASNELSYLILKAQEDIRLPQPNLTARLHRNSPDEFTDECSRIIGLGTGMPQVVNDESIIPAMRHAGIHDEDSFDYSLVGCVELSTSGNYLGWSDAAMFNLVKALELALNDGKCMLTGKQAGPNTGYLSGFPDYRSLEEAYRKQISHFVSKMTEVCTVVEKCHREHLPSPFLSSVVNHCLRNGTDVTAGGAKYNYSGIQAIQAANIADSLAVLKKLVFGDGLVGKAELLGALRNNFRDNEPLRQMCINRVPKYGNDVEWVDRIGAEWIEYFSEQLKRHRNFRGGPYQMGLYTVSAHVPMGQYVGATPDGRLACTPLADGGLSPMYGRDKEGPTSVLASVSRIPSRLAGNGSLLNMKFLPSMFSNETDRSKFTSFLKTLVKMPVHHIQFNVVSAEELKRAKADPEAYRGLTIRVAGYTAYFTELDSDLQDEIIQRTTQGENG